MVQSTLALDRCFRKPDAAFHIIAVSGEVTLHHDHAYIQVSQFGLTSSHGILIRACRSRKDFCGGPNHFVALTMLDDTPALAAAVRAITGVGREESAMSEFRGAA